MSKCGCGDTGPNAGELNERLEIQNPTQTRTLSGSARLTWASAGSVWGSVRGMSSRDVVMAMQSQSLVTHKIMIRWRDDVNAQTRLIWRGATLEVVQHLPRFDRRFIEILAREVEDDM